jgi:hypothetical protein
MIKRNFLMLILIVVSVFNMQIANAGNDNLSGQAGATELLINPWARSSGWGGSNSASVHGLEAMYLNVAGVAFTQKTEVVFANTDYLQGSGIRINAFGFTQRVGESGVIGLGIMSMTFGDIPITTTAQPEGGLGTFSPNFMNIGLSYAKAFSNSIFAGVTAKLISESIPNLTANGFALDAGIQYVTGIGKDKNGKKKSDNLKFGISLKNVGPAMNFGGDGLSFKTNPASTIYNNSGGAGSATYTSTVEQRAQSFELPSLVNIGVTYDLKLAQDHRLSIAGNFSSNSYTNDQYMLGMEYGFKSYLMLRGGFVYENGIFNQSTRLTVFTGPTAGVTFELPLGNGRTFGIDYAYRATNPFMGCHTFGARVSL